MNEQTNIFGHPIKPPGSGEDFTPIIKYDARAGRIFRVDRSNDGQGWVAEQIDITDTFKAIADFENMESGWMLFAPGAAPSFAMRPMSEVLSGQGLPTKPSEKHRDGVRFVLKLTKACGGDEPIREIAANSKSFVTGIERVYREYLANKSKFAGKLPVIMLSGKPMPVTTGSGTNKSTNYQPSFKITDWKPRPEDLIHIPAPQTTVTAAPATGHKTVVPPNQMNGGDAAGEDDFG